MPRNVTVDGALGVSSLGWWSLSHIADRANSDHAQLGPEHCGLPQSTANSAIAQSREPTLHPALAEIDVLKRRIAELEAAVTARDDFLAIAAHELRNPMTPILGQVERLNRLVARGSCSPAKISAGLTLIEQIVRLFIKRSTTLLDVSRMTGGKLKLRVETFDLQQLIQRVTKAHEPTAEHSGCVLNFAEVGPVMVALDELAVEQILDNILLNALRYGGGQPVSITLGYSDDRVWTLVRDRGIGISQRDRSRIFQRFEQAVSHSPHGGFGVGLWVVGQLVHAMGGEIEVDSVVNEGTTFKVTLPRFIAQTR
jgi:two-component system OmpR family sensor kinase